MTKLFLIFAVMALSVEGAEVSFRIGDDSAPRNPARIMLTAFDAFSAVASARPGCEVSVDAVEPIITFRYSHPASEAEMADLLVAAFVEKEQEQLRLDVEVLHARIASVQEELEREASPARRMLLQRVYVSMLPPLDAKRPPIPLRRVKKEAIQ